MSFRATKLSEGAQHPVVDSYARKIFQGESGSVGWVCLAVCLEFSLGPALSPAYLTSWLCRECDHSPDRLPGG